MSEDKHLQMNVVVNIGDDADLTNTRIPTSEEELPILAIRQTVVFPTVMMPLTLNRKMNIKLVKDAEKSGQLVVLATQRDSALETPNAIEDLYPVGVVAKVMKLISTPFGSNLALVVGLGRCALQLVTKTKPYMYGHIMPLSDPTPEKNDAEFNIMYDELSERAIEYAQSAERIPSEMINTLKKEKGQNRTMFVNFLCSNIDIDLKDRIEMLEEGDFKNRSIMLMRHLNKALEVLHMKQDILERTHTKLDKQQRKYYLQEQLRQIEKELGDGGVYAIADDLRAKAKKKNFPEKIAEMFENEVAKLASSDSHSMEYNTQLNYLETFVGLPWGEMSNDNLNLKHAQRILDRDHYGLKKVKERIIEHLAVLSLRGDNKSPIICLVGPPGVGKTSLGRSIAEALGREYIRISLGGLHDESEIRGHRRTYIGAMPGRIIKGLLKTSTDNPVFMLDEMDKIGRMSHNGDPSSALLEVLDPEQNYAFHDNYLDVDYDLSHVMFIATANTTQTIPAPLLDRMEVIDISGYIIEEKIEIARRHLISKTQKECGLSDYKISVNKSAITHLINNYTRESGVRSLEKQLNKLMRKIAVQISTNPETELEEIKVPQLEQLIGKPDYVREDYQGNDFAGVATGLAWTSVGGEILYIESSLSRGKGGKLTLTGNLGDVMKESAIIALEYIKAHADLFGIDMRIFENYNLHIHVPEGATPKDGPSAGITIATSIVSALTQHKILPSLAMTGEITLRGKVLPVGGIKEKILAAKRAGIKNLMLCEENRRNVEKIESIYLKGLCFHYINTIDEGIFYALTDKSVKNPVIFKFDEEKNID